MRESRDADKGSGAFGSQEAAGSGGQDGEKERPQEEAGKGGVLGCAAANGPSLHGAGEHAGHSEPPPMGVKKGGGDNTWGVPT
jgi:hypothetical protein